MVWLATMVPPNGPENLTGSPGAQGLTGVPLSPPITVTVSPCGTEATSESAAVADGSALTLKLPKSAVPPVGPTVTVPVQASTSATVTQLPGWPTTHNAPDRSGSRITPESATPATRSAVIEAVPVEPATSDPGPSTWNAAIPDSTAKAIVRVELPTCTVIGAAVASGATARVRVIVTAACAGTAGNPQRVVRPS